MKAISIKQPWANLIVNGQKGIEVRTWGTTYEGPLYLHASKTVDTRVLGLFRGVPTQPRGCLLATAYLSMCVQYEKSQFERDASIHRMPLSWWRPGLFGWLLVDVKKFKNPVEYKGQLGLFEVNL